ncbi:MAG: Hsp20/alpha crystallin family protein [Deltaproteobacteria bacterium]|jgi:HSP20 family molecular chaperone IbpA|nr:Hsp20/alpha crystallin family protein [Deltaproteobacteria bacterium]
MSEVTRKNAGVVPATDIFEMKDGFHIMVDLPGVKSEDLVVDIEESELSISGSSSYAPADNNLRKMHTEFGNNVYQRRFTLSELVDKEKVEAVLRDGVLQLYLPKAEAMKPRRIEIS